MESTRKSQRDYLLRWSDDLFVSMSQRVVQDVSSHVEDPVMPGRPMGGRLTKQSSNYPG